MRAIVSVATGPFIKGLDRLTEWCAANSEDYFTWRGQLPPGSPTHHDVPYAFKAFAMKSAIEQGAKTLLYCDASIIPVKSLERVWQQIQRDGYLIFNNGFSNATWTCEQAYPLLGVTKEENEKIPHVVGGCVGLGVTKPIGREFLAEWVRLAENGSFRGPWTGGVGVQHRHDQTALSVIAWRLGCQLTNAPDLFSYGKVADAHDERTVLIADGSY